jgi:hypothetical protein
MSARLEVRRVAALVVAALAVGAAGCAERQPVAGQPQASRAKADSKPWEGSPTAFAAPEAQKGDRGAWEKALRTRAENQNEYVRSR